MENNQTVMHSTQAKRVYLLTLLRAQKISYWSGKWLDYNLTFAAIPPLCTSSGFLHLCRPCIWLDNSQEFDDDSMSACYQQSYMAGLLLEIRIRKKLHPCFVRFLVICSWLKPSLSVNRGTQRRHSTASIVLSSLSVSMLFTLSLALRMEALMSAPCIYIVDILNCERQRTVGTNLFVVFCSGYLLRYCVWALPVWQCERHCNRERGYGWALYVEGSLFFFSETASCVFPRRVLKRNASVCV